MSHLLPRREFLKRAAYCAFAAGFGGIEVARKAADLYEQHAAWAEASRQLREFFERHEAELARLMLRLVRRNSGHRMAGQRRTLDGSWRCGSWA
jgi:hypothetical protein